MTEELLVGKEKLKVDTVLAREVHVRLLRLLEGYKDLFTKDIGNLGGPGWRLGQVWCPGHRLSEV